jgi:hypothetical protein
MAAKLTRLTHRKLLVTTSYVMKWQWIFSHVAFLPPSTMPHALAISFAKKMGKSQGHRSYHVTWPITSSRRSKYLYRWECTTATTDVETPSTDLSRKMKLSTVAALLAAVLIQVTIVCRVHRHWPSGRFKICAVLHKVVTRFTYFLTHSLTHSIVQNIIWKADCH